MKVYVVRHAWAVDRTACRTDAERPLTDEGRKRFAKFVRKLVKRGLSIDRIATSPLVRCRETAEILADGLPRRPEIELLDALRPDSDLEAIDRWLAEHPNCKSTALVGHAPDVCTIVERMIGGGAVWFPKGAAARVSFDMSIGFGYGELDWLVTPKLLNC
ncbi:phosphohistidine phosphatase SixA [Thermostilla marina]